MSITPRWDVQAAILLALQDLAQDIADIKASLARLVELEEQKL